MPVGQTCLASPRFQPWSRARAHWRSSRHPALFAVLRLSESSIKICAVIRAAY